MRILVVGNGAREHALVWKLSQSPNVRAIFTAPGNPGTHTIPKNTNIDISVQQIESLCVFAQAEGIDLTVVGPEQPLDLGIVDLFQSHQLRIFGPTQKAAKLECSKSFAKDVLIRSGVPTAKAWTFEHSEEAYHFLDQFDSFPLVLKADGLASGKGVLIAKDRDEAKNFIRDVMENSLFGSAGKRVLMEEFLDGEEASYFVIASGEKFIPFGSAQDHKRLLDGDMGPNTGGMGAYSPAPIVDVKMEKVIQNEIVVPTLSTMLRDGTPFQGFLYIGLMMTKSGPKVLEFNVRLGDPEAQVILPRIKSDFFEILNFAVHGHPEKAEIEWRSGSAMTVVLASEGYPQSPKANRPISIPSHIQNDTLIFHAGTQMNNDKLQTRGGRVLSITGLGATLEDARNRAYSLIQDIHFPGMQYRKDIGWRQLRSLS